MTNEEVFAGNCIADGMRMFRRSCRQFVQKECQPCREGNPGRVDRERGHPQ